MPHRLENNKYYDISIVIMYIILYNTDMKKSCLKYSHTHQTVTGGLYEVKRKGGRNPLTADCRRTRQIVIHTLPASESRFVEAQRKSGLSKSAFGDLILSVGLDNYLNQNTVYT